VDELSSCVVVKGATQHSWLKYFLRQRFKNLSPVITRRPFKVNRSVAAAVFSLASLHVAFPPQSQVEESEPFVVIVVVGQRAQETSSSSRVTVKVWVAGISPEWYNLAFPPIAFDLQTWRKTSSIVDVTAAMLSLMALQDRKWSWTAGLVRKRNFVM